MGLKAWITAGLFAAAAAQAGEAGWIHAKAWLAQGLLERAWQRSVEENAPVRPWPWADTWPVARLAVPRLGVETVVLAGANGEALAFGPGLAGGSAHPGAAGNAVIAGHRDTHFEFLRDLREDDRILVDDTAGRRTVFRVLGTQVVDSRVTVIDTGTATPALTLVACWPFDAPAPGGFLRYVVTARAVDASDDVVTRS